jgi:hypothetical protein
MQKTFPVHGAFYRTFKVVGSTVINETVGTIDDLIVTSGEKVPLAVHSVGGFFGMGTKYVVVPHSSLEANDERMMLRGATKDSLKGLPEFKLLPTAHWITGPFLDRF